MGFEDLVFSGCWEIGNLLIFLGKYSEGRFSGSKW
jgi:hypothetical protein